jgi:hypothetical protein
LHLRAPKGGGSHYTVSHPALAEILTIPRRRPLLPIYVRRFVSFVDTVRDIDEQE